MIALKSVNKQSLVEYEDLLFMLVDKNEESNLSQLYYVDAVIINSTDNNVFDSIFGGIRKHYNPNIYLKPVFAFKNDKASSIYQKSCDLLTDAAHYDLMAERTRHINKRIEKLFQLQRFPSPEMEMIYKTLQYMYTREEVLRPFGNRHSRINYQFPFLSWQYAEEDIHKILKILKTAQQEGYISTELLDKLHLCSDCGSAHHNIRETCKACSSIDLEIEDLVHHFQCAYIGPESDFKQADSDAMVCPKCTKVVRHIGIDYDKPSHIYNCRNCKNSFQDPLFTSNCMDCGDVKDIGHLEEELIQVLHLTSKGNQLVLRGMPRTEEVADQLLTNTVTGIYSYDVFQHLLKQEESRVSQRDTYSVLGRVFIIDEQLNKLGLKKSIQLQNELSKVLKNYTKASDMICPKSHTQYYFLLTDSSKKETDHIREMIEYNFYELLRGNIEDCQPEIKVDIIPLGGGTQMPDTIDLNN